jgi:hypothetical protein
VLAQLRVWRLRTSAVGRTKGGVVSGSWSNDPWNRFPYRWRDERGWTEHVSDGPNEYLDPPGDRQTMVATPPVQRSGTVHSDHLPPWYKTKRYWLYGFMGFVLLIVLFRSCGDDEASDSAATTIPTADTLAPVETTPVTEPAPATSAPVAETTPATAPVNNPTLLAFLPTLAEMPAGWIEVAVTADSGTTTCVGTSLDGTGIGDADPYPAEYAEVRYSQGDGAPIMNFAIFRGDLDLAAVAERVKTCNGVAEADGTTQQVADLPVAPVGAETYAFRVDYATAAPVTMLVQIVKVNGYVIMGGNIAPTGTEDQLLLELTMALVAGRAV